VITVSDSIADLYEKKYKIRPVVVRNVSPISDSIKPVSKEELGIPIEHFVIILQGGGIHMDKGGEEAIDSLLITENVSLIIAGSGDILHELKERVTRLGLSTRVKFTGMMPWNELMRITKAADAGLSLEKDTNINYRYSLPNKLFDYISAGIPVITGNLPEIRSITESFGFAISIPEITAQEISKAIIQLRDDRELHKSLKNNSIKASGTINWNTESAKVNELYSQFFSHEQN
jgi:glycosyltransferase involved in cell wall biosynthesis